MKQLVVLTCCTFLIYACGGNADKTPTESESSRPTTEKKADDGKGIGEIKEVALNNPLNADMVSQGKAIYEMKCAACHKLTDQRVVGPGWKGVTAKRKPEWIMNMATNVEVMLEEDPAARELLKECLVRMPNQNLSVGDARNVLEFMYMNDGGQVGNQ